ncbi:MAG TPA: hypothetical protein V6C65_36665 [Allocoleopsis sp.]
MPVDLRRYMELNGCGCPWWIEQDSVPEPLRATDFRQGNMMAIAPWGL